MATIDDAIIARAAAFTGLTALIGSQPNMRLYPVLAPQNVTAPYLTYQQVSGPRVHAMGTDPGVVNPRMQFSVWGRTNTEAKTIALQV
ncbi:MAG: tail completion protein gp17, partial [bacterium]